MKENTIEDLEELRFYAKFIPDEKIHEYRKSLKKTIKKLKEKINEEIIDE